MLVEDYMRTFTETKLGRKVDTIDISMVSRRTGKSIMGEAFATLKFRILGHEKMREQLLVDYCILCDEFGPATVIRDKIENEEERFVRMLDGTETDFLVKQFALLRQMKRNR